MAPKGKRSAKGTVVIDLVKLLKELRKRKPLPPLSSAAEQLLATRVLSSEWYPLEPFAELLRALDTTMLRGDETRTMELGVAGAMGPLHGPYRAYLKVGDPQGSVMAMRHAWRAHYDFGEITARTIDAQTVEFTLKDYPDVCMPHALMSAGWGVAAAIIAGAASSQVEVVARPWQGAPAFVYRVHSAPRDSA